MGLARRVDGLSSAVDLGPASSRSPSRMAVVGSPIWANARLAMTDLLEDRQRTTDGGHAGPHVAQERVRHAYQHLQMGRARPRGECRLDLWDDGLDTVEHQQHRPRSRSPAPTEDYQA